MLTQPALLLQEQLLQLVSEERERSQKIVEELMAEERFKFQVLLRLFSAACTSPNDLHMAQLMPLPLTISCCSKSRLDLSSGFTFLVLAHPSSPGHNPRGP